MIRNGNDEDAVGLRQLAELDSGRPPAGRVLIGEMEGLPPPPARWPTAGSSLTRAGGLMKLSALVRDHLPLTDPARPRGIAEQARVARMLRARRATKRAGRTTDTPTI